MDPIRCEIDSKKKKKEKNGKRYHVSVLADSNLQQKNEFCELFSDLQGTRRCTHASAIDQKVQLDVYLVTIGLLLSSTDPTFAFPYSSCNRQRHTSWFLCDLDLSTSCLTWRKRRLLATLEIGTEKEHSIKGTGCILFTSSTTHFTFSTLFSVPYLFAREKKCPHFLSPLLKNLSSKTCQLIHFLVPRRLYVGDGRPAVGVLFVYPLTSDRSILIVVQKRINQTSKG